MKFDPHTNVVFMWKWSANLYAWRARHNGYDQTKITYVGENWYLNGGRWSVSISNPEYRKWYADESARLKAGAKQ